MFSHVVALYRALGAPTIEDGVVSYEGAPTAEIISALRMCDELPAAYGKFEHLSDEADFLEIEFRLPSNESGHFYSSLTEFVARNGSLGKGQFPSNVYITELRWADSDDIEPPEIKSLRCVCRLIELLALLAIGVDKDSSPDGYNLFFALPPDGAKPPRTFLLPTQVDVKVLDYELNHLSLLEEILNRKNENKAHLSERKLMIRMAVASVIEKFESEPNLLLVIVREWREVLATYRANLQTYVYSFSFERVRREVAQAEIDYGTKLSGVLGDIAGKMLALPISLAGLVALEKTTSKFEGFILVLGLAVVSVVLLAILHNQMLQTERLLHSFNVIFDDFKDKIKTYPPKLQRLLRITIDQVDKQGQTLTRTFRLLKGLSLIPILGALVLATIKYWDGIVWLLMTIRGV
ncbi:hypothetical protein HBO23_03790 [Pseudomonas sp. WS 5532]|jgi:hypothetical protein|uniref:hypothetical protein n=1 Tax=unclassified Pseudomonas TaxID=196821 RepID=UPI0014761603|nr:MULTISPECIES: hypothetical protein [unclassified Pseudomonas]MDL2189003.1 hypothetical protein [Pseudomonas sp. ChxA]NMX72073.1 hypothetical protein [Pseudomonas sp. WS 5532]